MQRWYLIHPRRSAKAKAKGWDRVVIRLLFSGNTEYEKYRERHSLRIWAHLCPPAREILDVGANTGVYSLVARKKLEPVSTNADVLVE